MANYPAYYPAFGVSFPVGGSGTGLSNNPRAIFGNNLQLWLDAADPATITSVAGATSQWADKSVNGYHATQGTGARQPTTGLNTLNGRNVLNFDGGDDMSVNSALGAIMGGANTCWIVMRRATEAGGSTRAFTMSTSGTSNYTIDYSSTAGSIFCRHNNAGTGISNTGNTNTNFQLVRFRRNGTTQAVSVNNNTETSNTSAANVATVNEVTIGALVTSGRLVGDIAEIIMVNSSYDASASQTIRINQYITAKWGLTLA